ncbi:beta-phosphoglucomutase [Aquimarina sp. 2-A2]|uniref:beta-phosphoglucomutase n=1 Tax=Aquimarina sp. 2-A2 TaxID=3382644 RepID=UPI00387EFF94
MKKKGFIFDLDGVIVDTAKYHYLAWKNLAEELGISFSETQNEQLKGVSRIRSLEKILEWGNLEISQDKFDKLLVEKNEEYLSYIDKMDQNEILPDVVRVLEYLKTQNCGIALGSASKNARIILDKVSLREHFETIIDGTDVTKAKPDPEVFMKGAERLNIAPEHCVVFEDSVAGIQAANAAGMISIGIGDSAILYEADHVFKNFKEMDDQFINQLITTEKV